jgi:hypothetical protein
MSRRRRALPQVVAVAFVVALVVGCSDGEDGREQQAGNVTAPPATIETTTSTAPPGTQPSDEPDDGSTGEGPSLAGTAWLLHQVVEPGEAPLDARSGPVPAVVTFTERGVDVYDGVNTVGGEYSMDGDEVRLELGTPSQFPYPGDSLPQYALIGHLARLERAAVEGGWLRLTLTDGTQLSLEQAAGGTAG